MTPAQDVASYRWPALTAPRCTTHLAGGVLVCRGDRGHRTAGIPTGHSYVSSSVDDRHTQGEECGNG